MKQLLWIFAIGAIALPSHALACLGLEYHQSLIHSGLPRSLPKTLVVARVEITSGDPEKPYELQTPGIRARVKQLVQGNLESKEIILRSRTVSLCDYPLDNGRSGLIVGIAREVENGAQVVEPIMVGRGSQFRLPEGYTIPTYFTASDYPRLISKDVNDSHP